MRFLLILLVLLAASPARAQEQATYTPVVIDEATYTKLMNYLLDVPARYAVPLLNTLKQLEQEAQAKAAQDAKDKKK